jgi:23S rRNA (guanosine2251-2'-O)-methyltransferase
VIVYGRNPVAEALRGRRAESVREVWAAAGAQREQFVADARGRGVRVHDSGPADIERLCGSPAHQGVCADAGAYPYASDEALLERGEGIVVVLDQVQDPQNLGSICRTAECAGAAGVVIAERRAAAVTPAVCKAAAGAVEHLAVAQTRNVADFLLGARERGFWCYGASAAARSGLTPPVPYDRVDYGAGGVVLVLGGEESGLRPRVASACDQLICLPMRGRSESLGVAAAAAALLYGILQQRCARVDKAP